MDLFGFFPLTEARTQHAAVLAGRLAKAFSMGASAYGDGVKSITATLILTDPDGLGRNHRVKRPRYRPGTREITGHGVTVRLEDELEFSIRPVFSDICGVTTEAELAAALVPAIAAINRIWRGLKSHNSACVCFFRNLRAFYEGPVRTESTCIDSPNEARLSARP
jgi:hypothetical protein